MPSASMPSGDSQTEASADITVPTVESAKMRYEAVIRKQEDENDKRCLERLERAINAGDQRVVICPSDTLLKKLTESGYTITPYNSDGAVFVSWVDKAQASPCENNASKWCVVL